MSSGEGKLRSEALDYFRRLVALTYREIGVLETRNHEAVAAKAKRDGGFFGDERKKRATQLYRMTLAETATAKILNPYERQTGLSLEDVLDAFENGEWRNSSGGFSYGGPKWASIVRCAIQLRDAIGNETWVEIEELLKRINTLEHNTGRIVVKFSQLDR